MLEFLEDWLDRRRTKALLCAFAEWQNDPSRELGEFGLSVTTDVSTPVNQVAGYVGIQFTLHHSSGAHYHSGTYRLPCTSILRDASDVDDVESGYFDWLPDVAGPLLNEFLLPSGISDGYQRSVRFEPLKLVEP
jgi:hypothetical protein